MWSSASVKRLANEFSNVAFIVMAFEGSNLNHSALTYACSFSCSIAIVNGITEDYD